MRKIIVYCLSVIAILASCAKEAKDSSIPQIAGMWAQVNDDKTVAKLIEFKDGAYIEYTPEYGCEFFYNKRCIWHSDKSKFRKDVIHEYYIFDGELRINNNNYPISCYQDTFIIGNKKYYYVESINEDYGFTVSHDVNVDKQNQTLCLSSAQEICWSYSLPDLPDFHKLVVNVDADWIQSINVTESQIKFEVKENQSLNPRVANFTFSHPAIANVVIKLQQMIPGQVISSNLTSINYAEEDYDFLYLMENPTVNKIVDVSCSSSWITDIKCHDGKVTFKVLENNSGASRNASIILTCGDITATHMVEQSYNAPQIVLTSEAIVCKQAASTQSFTYVIRNPRKYEKLNAISNTSWINNVSVDDETVTFKVLDNMGPCRMDVIELSYMSDMQDVMVEQDSHGVANSYVVSHVGTFKIEATQGTSKTSVGNVASVAVLWESFGTDVTPNVGDLIQSISFKNGFITFKTSDTYKKGNAVIAAKDANEEILWSWHIWFTDYPKSQKYYRKAGTMMDRNLGATSATPRTVESLGLIYQWGRKDPFLGASSISSNNLAKSSHTWPGYVESSNSTGTMAYSIANPTTFIGGNDYNNDWYYTGSTQTDNNRWTISSEAKSKYDPCPSGWRIPDGGSKGIWTGAGLLKSTCNTDFDYGFDFSGYLGNTSIWYPAAGHFCSGGKLCDVGMVGRYWSATPNSESPLSVFCLSVRWIYIQEISHRSRSSGFSVRCAKE